MRRGLVMLAVSVFVLGIAMPTAGAEGTWLGDTKDKAIRGIENGLFGMGGEIYHHVTTRSEKGALEDWTLGFWNGIHRGLVRTLVGAYELATPFYHDQPVLSDLDEVVTS